MALVAIVLPFYNRAGYLARAVESVLSQTFTDWHLYLVDDASTDESSVIAKKYAADFAESITYLTQPSNQGVSAARNLGMQESESTWIALLDSDDEWLPNKLQQQILRLEQTGLRICHTEEIWIRNGVRVNPHKKHQKRGGRIFIDSLSMCKMSPSSIVFHRSLLAEHGMFREDFPVCEDYDLWLKFSSTDPCVFIESPQINKYGGHEDQLSRRFHSMDLYRLRSLLSLLPSPHLSETERRALRECFHEKARIFALGCEKHNNLSALQSLKVLQQQFLNLEQ